MLSPRAARILLYSIWVLVLSATSSIASADIFRWDNGQLIPGTAGIVPGPGVKLNASQLDYANLSQRDLRGANFYLTNLSHADLTGSNLTHLSSTIRS